MSTDINAAWETESPDPPMTEGQKDAWCDLQREMLIASTKMEVYELTDRASDDCREWFLRGWKMREDLSIGLHKIFLQSLDE